MTIQEAKELLLAWRGFSHNPINKRTGRGVKIATVGQLLEAQRVVAAGIVEENKWKNLSDEPLFQAARKASNQTLKNIKKAILNDQL